MNFEPFGDFRVAPTPAAPAETVGEREVRRTFTHTGLCYALLMLLHFGITFGLSLIIRRVAPEFYGNYNSAFFLDSLPFYLITIPAVALLMRRIPQEKPRVQKIGAGAYAMLITVMCLFLVAGSLMGTMVSSVVEALTGHGTSAGGNELLGQTNPWLALLFAGVLGPIAEEFICRKVLIDGLHRYGDRVAILASAVTFGLMHGNFAQCFYAFGIGLVFGYIYCRSGKLYLSVLPHVALNCVSILISSFVLPRLMPLTEKLNAMTGDAMTDEAMRAFLAEAMGELPAMLAAMLYSALLYGGAFVGLVLLLVFYRRIHLVPSRYFIAFEDGRPPEPVSLSNLAKPAWINPGTAAFFVLVIAYFVLSVL